MKSKEKANISMESNSISPQSKGAVVSFTRFLSKEGIPFMALRPYDKRIDQPARDRPSFPWGRKNHDLEIQ